MLHRFSCLYLSACILSVLSSKALAWGERGHDHVAIVAARLAEQELGASSSFAQLLRKKELMLGHLANVPDIVWKAIDPATVESNSLTHFIDLEYVTDKPSLATLPRSYEATVAAVRRYCQTDEKDSLCAALGTGDTNAVTKSGTAPLRVQQLQQMMVSALRQAGQAKDKAAMVDAVNEALLVGGVMAHFVGDLAQPMHTSKDYDGYERGNGGLHGYFESDLVDAQDLELLPRVYKVALPRKDLKTLLSKIPAADLSNENLWSLVLAQAEALDSHAKLDALYALDKKFALKRPSSSDNGKKRTPALRVDPSSAALPFRAMIEQRLSLGAQVLAHIWVKSYQLAGSPDLSAFQSYFYPVAPTFIVPTYVTSVH